ncbi:hypothetical protein [Streptomyces sp. NPDC005148]
MDTGRPGLEPLTESPQQPVRRLYVDCLSHDPAVVDLAVLPFGEDRLPWPRSLDAMRAGR